MLQRITRRINEVVRFTGTPNFPRLPLLLTPGTVQEFLAEGPVAVPIIGPDGASIWFNCSPALGIFDPATRMIRYIPTASGSMQDVVLGPDGNVWYGSIGAFSSSGPVGRSGVGNASPSGETHFFTTAGWAPGLAAGADRVWFTQQQGATGGGWVSTVDYTLHTFAAGLTTADVLAAPDNSAWFGAFGPKLYHVSSDGKVTEYTTKAAAITGALAFDGGGNLWYGTDIAIGCIARDGTQHEFDIGGNGAFSIIFGAQVWFASSFSSQIGSMNYDGSGLQMYNISGLPAGVVFGIDENPWFTEFTNRLGTIKASGVVEYPTQGAQPYPPILASDGNVWFSDSGDGSIITPDYIGRVTPAGDVAEFRTTGIPSGLLSATDASWLYFGENAPKLGRVFVGADVVK
jgi:streptogramin lyase